MLHAVKHIGLDGGVVVHVLKGDAVAYLERFLKTPVAHIVPAEA